MDAPPVHQAHPVHPADESRPRRVGRRGEQVAAGYLRQRGYRVLDRNWRSPDGEVPGELDLVLRYRGTLVICEVKARTGGRLAHPAEAVTPEKAARLRRLAVVWLREHDRHHSVWRPAVGGLPALIRAATSFVAPSGASPAPPPAAIRIDVVAVRLAPREPFPVLGVDHLIGVA
ncbi:YraN family protein [Actinospica robiniae]|uniref:YraN family protein n=1 Tax=Actinospica robiniae TaxID=304901 RepID=UPI00041A8F3E|nr:YraN family protein [Actinospica robiniae]